MYAGLLVLPSFPQKPVCLLLLISASGSNLLLLLFCCIDTLCIGYREAMDGEVMNWAPHSVSSNSASTFSRTLSLSSL